MGQAMSLKGKEVIRVAVFEVDSYVIIQGKEDEHERVLRKIFEYGKKHPDISKYVKSLRVFRQGIGGDPVGRIMMITEFQSLTDMEKFYELLNRDREWIRKRKEWASVIDMNTMRVNLWNDRLRDLWIEK
jgi:hypothetical protein